jgi:hypothetical protein
MKISEKPLLNDQIDVAESNILDFRFSRKQGDKGRRKLLDKHSHVF